MSSFIAFIIWVVCAWACYSLAKEKNRNEVLGACMGLLFGVFAVIVYACLSKKE